MPTSLVTLDGDVDALAATAPTDGPVRIPVGDGVTLAGALTLPADGSPRVAVALHPATGVPMAYYAAFARWFADAHQAAILTYDYSDFGASAVGPVRASTATMATWAVRDQSAALDHLVEIYPDLPVWVIGHSLGGMYNPFHRQAARISRLFAVASGPAYWRKHPLGYMPAVIAFWFLLGPAATRLLGYLPGKALGLGADLPAGVYWQWRRWCLSPDFNRADWGGLLPMPDLHAIRGGVHLISLADDVMIPPERVEKLAAFYPAATVDHRTLDPKAFGLGPIGHIALFSRRMAEVWPGVFRA